MRYVKGGNPKDKGADCDVYGVVIKHELTGPVHRESYHCIVDCTQSSVCRNLER